MSSPFLLTFFVLWVASSTLAGLLIALVARRIHPSLSLRRAWLYYSVLMAFLVGVVVLLGVT